MALTRLLPLRRYDAVIHLVTAADGAEEFYTLDDEEGVRTETPEQVLVAFPATTNDSHICVRHALVYCTRSCLLYTLLSTVHALVYCTRWPTFCEYTDINVLDSSFLIGFSSGGTPVGRHAS